MKQPLLLFLRGLMFCCALLTGSQAARAGHVQGGQLTYTYLSTAANGNQQYQVRFSLFADCNSFAPQSYTLNAVNTCGAGATVAMLSLMGQPVPDAPYCTALQGQTACNSSNPPPPGYLPNFSTITYEGTITLPPAAEWILSVDEMRSVVGNLTGVGMHLEARLCSRITPAGGGPPVVVASSSPTFDAALPAAVYLYENQQAIVSFAATDQNPTSTQRDSLVYSMERPLAGCNMFVPYKAYPSGCLPGIDPKCATRLIRCAAPVTTYLATRPLPVRNDTIRTAPCTPPVYTFADAVPAFRLNTTTGLINLDAAAYVTGPTAATQNRYVVVGQVTQYRKINGVYYRLGAVRREFLVLIIPATGNLIPSTPTPVAGPAKSNLQLHFAADTMDVTATTGNYSRLRLTFTDPNNSGPLAVFPPQNLNVIFPIAVTYILLQNGTIGVFNQNSNFTPRPTATFVFQPGTAAAGQTILIPFRVEDDACPIRGVRMGLLRLRLIDLPQLPRIAVAGQSLTPVTTASSCPGGTLQLLSRIGRPDSVRDAATGQVTAQRYAYQWGSTNANPATNGLPAVRNTPDLAVNPTVDTRYTLSMTPVYGFAPGSVVDTTSIVVRVRPLPASITRIDNTLRSSISTGNQWYLNGQLLPGATGQTYAVSTPGTYTVVVTYTTGPTTCTAAASAPFAVAVLGSRQALPGTSLSIAPNPTADGRVRVQLTGYQQAATLRVFDMLGRQVQQQQVSAPNPAGTVRELDLSQQPAGVYLLQVQTTGGMDIRRIVRQ